MCWINGKYEVINPTQTAHETLKIGKRVKVAILVHWQGDQGGVTAKVDGIPPIRRAGPLPDITAVPDWPTIPANRLRVGSNRAQYTVHALRFKTIDDTAKIIKRITLESGDTMPK